MQVARLSREHFDTKSRIETAPEFFECPVCFVVHDNIMECVKCSSHACVQCLEDFSKAEHVKNPSYKAQKVFKCIICHHVALQRTIHKFLFDLLQDLKFKCDSCKRVLAYSIIKGHKQRHECFPMLEQEINIDVEMKDDDVDFQPNNQEGQGSLVKSLYIFERDSKIVYEFELQSQILTKKIANTSANFPHNFQTALTPSGRLYFIGGGDFNQNAESLFKCYEVNTTTFEFMNRDKMKYARHGHSVCSLSDKFIIVTGSRKETENAHQRCEQYNIDLDIWFDISSLNEGRHYHASCSFRDKFVYVFCGISNATKKYVNTIERYDNQTRKNWDIIAYQGEAFSGRQGLGVAQLNHDEILVFGGFSGRFLKDAFIFNPMKKDMKKATTPIQEIFSFQMPTVYEKTTGTVFTVDWQKLKIFSYKSHAWNVVSDLKK